ncbi:MAG: hypothetical protein HKO61_03965 [Flavobacteriaceae bacterium]|nr:hypothetical protein [Bacteroidia bacterium]NNE03578.1 hypothetical protein [Eudoraea sp.]NNM08300.1 hypothetical protein [Flavobacteriaceae bacterium]
MKKATLFLGFLFIIISAEAQVGIGTVTPDASSILDLSATDKGILIPQVSLSDVTDTMLDGINIAATGLLIYNTNGAVIGGNGEGYYYFSGTQWDRLVTYSEAVDADWHEESTTNNPNAISDDIYTEGNVAIGKNTADYPLEVQDSILGRAVNVIVSGSNDSDFYGLYSSFTNSGSGNHYGAYNDLSGTGSGRQYGLYNNLVTTNSSGNLHRGVYNRIEGSGGFALYGMDNRISGTTNGTSIGIRSNLYASGSGGKYGVLTQVDGGTGVKYGIYNNMNHGENNTTYGVYNQLYGIGDGIRYATYNYSYGPGTGDRYGTYSLIDQTAGGSHYGIFSDVRKTGNFSGYFIGNFIVDVDDDQTNSNGLLFVNIDNNFVGIGTETPAYKLDVNGKIRATDVNFSGLLTFADDASAGAGGLAAGDMYKTATGELRIKL